MSSGRVVALAGVVLAAILGNEAAANDLTDTARFLAGKGVGPDSPLAKHQTPAYTEYAAHIRSTWAQFEEPNLERMRAWWKGRGPATASTVFYPFSGPDIANALVLFPDADTYLLFGLEAPGTVPDLATLDDDAIGADLTAFEASLGTVLQVNYFFTKAMQKKLAKGPSSSITGLVLFFLATSDCEVKSAKPIAIGAHISGIEIAFRRPGHAKDQTIRYFMVNVADDAKTAPDFLAYVKRQGRVATMIKSASYLMHEEGAQEPVHFTKMRALILAQSDFVVQDDSGVPLRLFARETWTLQFHGKYEAPTTEFARFLQRDLRVEMQRNSTGKIPFSYGYAYKQGESNLMTAERRP